VSVVADSLSYRALRSTGSWVGSAARDSWVGGFFLSLTGAPRRAFSDSEVFGLRRNGSHELEKTGHPWSVLVISRPYHWLRASIGDRVAGRGRGVRAGICGHVTCHKCPPGCSTDLIGSCRDSSPASG
jgi:hypothetical protein